MRNVENSQNMYGRLLLPHRQARGVRASSSRSDGPPSSYRSIFGPLFPPIRGALLETCTSCELFLLSISACHCCWSLPLFRRSRQNRKAITPMASTPSGTPTPTPIAVGKVDDVEASGEGDGAPLVAPAVEVLLVLDVVAPLAEEELGLTTGHQYVPARLLFAN